MTMLVRQGIARSPATDRKLAVILAAVAGAANSAAFHAFGFFAANMTGNVSSASDRLARGLWRPGGFYLGIVLVFIAGAFLSSSLIHAGQRRGIPAVYAYNLLLESILMGALGLTASLWPDAQRDIVLILGLSFLMGLQNALVTRISDARVRTTHISGTATDIGIELSMLASRPLGDVDRTAYRSNLRLHLQTILAFLGGGVLGVALFLRLGFFVIAIAALPLFVLAVLGIRQSRFINSAPPAVT